MSWKDDYREDYNSTDLTWDEYHQQKFIHVDEIADTKLDDLNDELEALMREYRQMKREISELKIMLESEEYEP